MKSRGSTNWRSPMEYRGVAYGIRAHLGMNKWNWTIYSAAGVSLKGEVTGPRQCAVVAVQQAIDSWLKKNRSIKSNVANLGNDEAPATRPGFCFGNNELPRARQRRSTRELKQAFSTRMRIFFVTLFATL